MNDPIYNPFAPQQTAPIQEDAIFDPFSGPSPEEQAKKRSKFVQIMATGGWAIPDEATGMDKVLAWGLRAIPGAQVTAATILGRQKDTRPQEEATGMGSAFFAGLQASSAGLIARGDKPHLVLGPGHAQWYNKLSAATGQLLGDLPAMIAGGAAAGLAGIPSGPGAIAAAGAGGFAAPAALREALMLAYDMDTVSSSGEFLGRVGIGVAHTAKEGAIGAAASVTGYGVAAKMESSLATRVAAGTLSEGTAKMLAGATGLAAENTVMTVTPALLEGKFPEPSDFANAAILMVGMKGAQWAGGATSRLTGRLREVYARTGVRPEEALADVNRGVVKLEELVKPEEPTQNAALPGETGLMKTEPDLPEAYRARAAQETVQRFFEQGAPLPDTIEQMGQELFGPRPAIDGEPPAPSQNYRTINGSDDMHAVLERWTQINLEHMQTQQGKRSFDSIAAEAEGIVAGMLDGTVAPRNPGDPISAARLLATKGFLEGVTQDVAKASQVLARLPENANPELKVAVEMEFKMALSRAQLAIGELRGASSEAGRALGVMRALKQASTLADIVEGKLLEGRSFDGKPMPLKEQAAIFAALDSPEQIAKFAKKMNQATWFDKFLEMRTSGLVAGPWTHIANLTSNTGKVLFAPILDTATAVSTMFTKNPVPFHDAVDRVMGNIAGVRTLVDAALKLTREDGVGKVARDFLLTEKYAGERTQAPAIEGTKGSVVRAPLRALELEDVMFEAVVGAGQKRVMAGRQARTEGLQPGTREYNDRVSWLTENPPADIAEAAAQFAERELFRADLGKFGKGVAGALNAAPVLKMFIPFLKTPLNVFKDTFEMTPLAWASDKFRSDIAAGGQTAARAYTKMVVGSAVSGAVVAWALDGNITGGGDPDPARRRAKLASGWQPYSVKVGDTWYSYQRIQPFGTLVGMAADVAEASHYMSEAEADKLAKSLGSAFANAVTNQTFLKGLKDLMDGFSGSPNKVATLFRNTVASSIPFSGLTGQMAEALDPHKREIQSTLDAIKNKIPGARNTLEPSIDPLGEPIQSTDRMGVFPISTKEVSHDKVRTEMGRLQNLTVGPVPKNINVPSARQKDIGKIELTPAQRTTFATEGGKLAYQVLHDYVNSPEYDAMSDMERVMVYDAAIRAGNRMGQFKAVDMQQRLEKQLEIVQEINKRLERKGP